MKLVFLGTPQFAVPTLEACLAAGHQLLAVYTQPDRPKGRGQALAASPVKEAALAHQLEIRQPVRIRAADQLEPLRALEADAMVVVGYGQIIPQSIIDLPRYGILNVHASLLPKYRGAAPIQWAVANGEASTGVTIMRIDAGLDTGDMLLKAETPISREETAVELGARLAPMGAELLVQALAGLEAGTLVAEPQDPAQATLAPILNKELGEVDWSQPAEVIFNRARGFQPWPGCYTRFRDRTMQITRCQPSDEPLVGDPGSVVARRKRLFVACGHLTTLELLEVQIEGRRRATAADFLNGQRISDNERLGVTLPSAPR
ncbi:MAG: methionyl-tRNA formyltransferase [Acidobacteria bacterium]|nr:methionyl-tRNA formyltransferase [Acidobacteriota bacterium]